MPLQHRATEAVQEMMMVYDRNREQRDYYGRQDPQDYGRDYGSGRDYSYSSARDYAATGEYGRGNDRYRDDDRTRDWGGDNARYGQREYGNAGYARNYSESSRGYGRSGYGTEWNDRDDSRQGYGRESYGRQGYGSQDYGRQGSGRSDYGRQSYDRGYGQNRFQQRSGADYGRQPQGYDYDERGFFSRAGDEVRSWFGDEDAERRREMDARYDERAYGDRDNDYYNWRRGQIDALDRDYDEYRREHRSKFENEFSTWRTGRQGQRDLLNKVDEHMEVVGSDGTHVGTVDKVRGDRILLTKNDADAGGRHHSIPSSWLKSVDTKVHLSKSAEDAKKHWRDEERNQAMFGDREETGSGRDAQGRILNRSFSGTY
jgi:hypothetical protein